MNLGQIHDAKSKKLILQPNKQQFEGGCVFCTKEVLELPMHVSFDSRVVYKGECCIFEYVFHDHIIVFHVFATGNRFGDDLEVLCRIGDKPQSGGSGRTYQELIHMKNISLEDVIESSFTISSMRTHENKRFRAGIGRNLNLPDGHDKTDNPLEIDNVIFEGRLLLQ